MELLFIGSNLVSFICGGLLVFFAYRAGVSDRQKIEKKLPIKKPKQKKYKPNPKAEELAEGIENILSYDGREQK